MNATGDLRLGIFMFFVLPMLCSGRFNHFSDDISLKQNGVDQSWMGERKKMANMKIYEQQTKRDNLVEGDMEKLIEYIRILSQLRRTKEEKRSFLCDRRPYLCET